MSTLLAMDPKSLRLNWVERPTRAPRLRPLLTPFRVVTSITALTALLAVYAIPRGQSVQPPREPSRFDNAMADTAIFVTTTPKSDMETPARVIDMGKPVGVTQASFDPRPVKTERVVPEPPAKVAALRVEEEEGEVRPARRTRSRGGDVCSRHGMRKVMVGQYRWRCRR